MQKRRRVTRACDECRRKKIKCDGKQPCTHCTVYSYECTYDQPSNRRRNPAPQYIEGLEHRVHRAETLLRMLMPDLNLNDPSIDVAVAQGYIPGFSNKPVSNHSPATQPTALPRASLASAPNADQKDTNLESMVRAIGQLELDEQGNWDYHGHSSGLSFVRRMREQLGDLLGPEAKTTPFVKSRPMSQVFDSPRSLNPDSPGLGMEGAVPGTDLPSRTVARDLCETAITDASVLMRAIHVPSFWASFDRMYNTPYENYTNQDHKFLPLLYSTMSVGCLFGSDEQSPLNQAGYETAIDQGFKYFRTARQLLDIADCRDLTSIQAVLYMISFLQCSAKLSQCYAYVGVALRSALRMGLHRNNSAFNRTFNPIEAETRKRVFWTIRKMDIYVGAMLGLPQTLSEEDIDQEYPLEVDDEYITEEGIFPMPEGTTPLTTVFNAHSRLVELLIKIVRNVYPIRAKNVQSNMDRSYTVPFSVIRDIEKDLETWKSNLPAGLDPCNNSNPKLTRGQQLLRIAYAHAQAMLYRPFLHFVATDKRSRDIDQRAYTCAASYVNLSRNHIHLCVQMKQKGLLNGAHWFVMYTTFFAVVSLIYFAAENPQNITTEAVLKDAIQGKEVLASLAKRSMAADRCAITLDGIFKALPAWAREGHPNPAPSRKRRQSSTNGPPKGARSHPDISVTAKEPPPPQPGSIQRASTFPNHPTNVPTASAYDQRMSFPTPSMSSGSAPYTPASPGFSQQALVAGPMENSSPSNGLLGYLPLEMTNPNLPDLSAMMFPSAEPFNYPNQPLTTFENNQFAKDPNVFNNFSDSKAPVMLSGQSTGSETDNLEAQFYPLPPYMMQQQQQRQQQQGRWDMNMMQQQQQQAQLANMRQVSGGWPGQQQGLDQGTGFPNINLSDMFGGENDIFSGGMLMDQGFRGTGI
ncbi:fungal transcriptional regulatory protein [Aureobasidium namibiae CBS 147.97]|uniref:Fungal transcriptional regulatory protein n=1 Tax=Aureobasidium namibiae CBS 147.97 TaxID=1043004 RepID=A0A074WV56_9PEZI|nr:fungal transcriptional regulatory protein [Aureobasidium namibiae CBS 147.97]KEQ75439.1 fungal transcriptional regulatory protein [Aureobasidium namibiae CBS 147.97]